MGLKSNDYLYSLLPEIYRRLDQKGEQPLRALLALANGEYERIEAAIEALYDNWFVETCDVNSLTNIAGLTGFEEASAGNADFTWLRAAVANTLACRRRKGTAVALERRLQDLTGWVAHAVPQKEHASGDWDILLWRKPVYVVEGGTPHHLRDGHYSFHSMGVDTPLYQSPVPRYRMEQPVLSENLPLAIEAHQLADAVAKGDVAIRVFSNAEPNKGWVRLELRASHRGPWEEMNRSADVDVAYVDPTLGRFLLPERYRVDYDILVDYGYAFSGGLGGGPYAQHTKPNPSPPWVATVAPGTCVDELRFNTLAEALRVFRLTPSDGTIRILDSRTYEMSGGDWIGGAPDGCGSLPDGHRTLTIEAVNGSVPCLRGDLQVLGAPPGMRVNLRGLWIDGSLMAGGELSLHIEHCTLLTHDRHRRHEPRHVGILPLPGRQASLLLNVAHSICGPIELPQEMAGLYIFDSILDAQGGPAIRFRNENLEKPVTPIHLERSTVLGSLAEVTLQQVDCLVVPIDDNALVQSTRYGDPAFCQLRRNVSAAISEGASNGSELGAFNSLQAQARTRLLEAGIAEYVPHGIHANVIWES